MTEPVHGVLNSIPRIINIKISYKRLEGLVRELEFNSRLEALRKSNNARIDKVELALSDIEYSYKKNDGEIFNVGPINYKFKSGEITFITGGNGSGKSTLAKLLTGLYRSDKGDIYLTSSKISPEDLREYYSTVFISDYYLFQKLYGINYKSRMDKISELLKILCVHDKVVIENGKFSTITLSSGQRKRLALLISYLEDRPIYLFDEWAADQDPEFKKFFYEHFLLDLKKAGKCIIAITHDDRYFDKADRVLKMENGRIIGI